MAAASREIQGKNREAGTLTSTDCCQTYPLLFARSLPFLLGSLFTVILAHQYFPPSTFSLRALWFGIRLWRRESSKEKDVGAKMSLLFNFENDLPYRGPPTRTRSFCPSLSDTSGKCLSRHRQWDATCYRHLLPAGLLLVWSAPRDPPRRPHTPSTPRWAGARGRAYLLGARSLETTTQAGKSGLRQARRSSSRAPLVSASACSRYSSSVRNLPAGLSAARHRFVFLKHAAFGCWSPGHSWLLSSILKTYKNTFLRKEQWHLTSLTGHWSSGFLPWPRHTQHAPLGLAGHFLSSWTVLNHVSRNLRLNFWQTY